MAGVGTVKLGAVGVGMAGDGDWRGTGRMSVAATTGRSARGRGKVRRDETAGVTGCSLVSGRGKPYG